ncbi:MAG: phosphate acyltransferase PlsX [Clostridia bacterium]|nr:phosphate acyltransferase PlsX [Clostridia bacterium]
MRIVVDAFGGDNAPLEIIKGSALAEKEYGAEIILCGDEAIINNCIKENNIVFNNLTIVNATDVISMHDEPTSLLKAHKDSSMAVAFRELAEGRADAFVSAGSTGAVVVGGTFIVKRIKGIKRPALAAMLPSPTSHYMMMDIGANAECRPEMLEQFAIMASKYLEKVEGIENPTVGLLNIGTEETKGTELQKEAYKLLENCGVNFVGNIESRELPTGACNAVITDGYTGNIALKLIEGTATTLFSMLKPVFLKNIITKLCYIILKDGLRGLKNKMNASEVGGAPLLGTKKPVFKAHGNSDAFAFKNAIHKAMLFAQNEVISSIEDCFSEKDN